MKVIELLREIIRIDSTNPFKTIIKNGKEIGIGNEKKMPNILKVN